MKIGITKNGTLVKARKADRNEKYFCPSCQRALKLCSGQYKNNYFAHQSFTKKQGYQPKGETKRHLMGKKKGRRFLQSTSNFCTDGILSTRN